MHVSSLIPLSLSLLLLCSCLTPDNVIEIDHTAGKTSQRRLIDTYFPDETLKYSRAPLAPGERPSGHAVSAAWWGFDQDDSTRFLQAALNSGAPIILVPRMPSPWITQELYMRSNTTLLLEEGTVLLAKKGAFRRGGATLLTMQDVSDITVYGYGAVIRMRKKDYTSPPYRKAEWRHTIKIRGGTRITLQGVTTEQSGGDGVYLGRGQKSFFNNDIVLKDLILRDHYRQGVSVISAVNLLIENTEMSGTSGTAPSAGIDFEPNRADEQIRNCRLKNCLIRNNAGAGFQAVMLKHTRTSAPFDITLENCTIYGNFLGTYVAGFQNGAHGALSFIRNRIYGIKLIPPLPEKLHVTER